MSFDVARCIEKQVWCGDGAVPQNGKYSKTGSRMECLKKGFGAGMYNEREKYLPPKSLQRIKYVGQKMEENFILYNIVNTDDLVQTLRGWGKSQKKDVLKYILRNDDGSLNRRAYNSVLLYLHNRGVLKLPKCKK